MRNASCIALLLAGAGIAAPASAAIHIFSSPLSPEASGATGTGLVTVTFDTDADTLGITASWSGLSGTTSVAHIHCCTMFPGTGTAGVVVTPGTLPGFPVGTSAGSYAINLSLADPNTYTGAFLTANGGTPAGAEAALLAGIQQGRAYFNIHSTSFPAGEIRGFLAPVPEPATWAMMIAGFGLVGGLMRARRRAVAKIAWNPRRSAA